jgi:stage V sporulation protein D (sporulation-specific penicillin-binding protein)
VINYVIRSKGEVDAHKGRLTFVVIFVMITGSVLFGRLFWLQVIMKDEYSQRAASQYREKVIIEPYRGTIYDRNGRPLTDNVNDYFSVSINPYNVTKPKQLARDLAKVTGGSAENFMKKLERSSQNVVLARKLKDDQVQALKKLGWELVVNQEIHRRYPHGNVAGQLIGFTDIDNNGISGIELAYNELLLGDPGWMVVQRDVQGNQHFDKSFPHKPHHDGGNLILTLDMSIQLILEEELSKGLNLYNGRSGSGIIIDPLTGEIIAMASQPGFDPNYPNDFTQNREKNTVITDLYEPGSTFKLIGATLLLDEYHVSPDKMVDCGNGSLTIHGKTIHDSHGYGWLTFRDVVAKSSNIGMIKLTSGIDHKLLYDKIKKFGFLETSGIELSGEAIGSLPEVQDWSGLTRPNVVIGHGIAVTGLQMCMAYCAVANGGILMKPTVIKELRYKDGRIEKNLTEDVRRIMSAETAKTLQAFLRKVVTDGTGKQANIDDMPISGKTGTAQIVNHKTGGYYQNKYISSFCAYFPSDTPQYLIMITINDPQGPNGEHTGGNVCAPVFRNISERILGLKPELWALNGCEGKGGYDPNVVVPDFCSKDSKEASNLSKQLGLKVSSHGNGVVYDQVPAPGTIVSKGDVIELTFGPEERLKGAYGLMPVLTGLSLRDAVRKATESGLMVRIEGSGRVVKQLPKSGSRVTVGGICSITAAG